MRKIINKKLYDTETATAMHSQTFSDEYETWFMYETMYKKRNGEYFLFREMCGDGDSEDVYNWVMRHRFQPLTIDDAQLWMEHYTDADAYAAEFGMPEE